MCDAGFSSFKPFERWLPCLCRPALVFRHIMSDPARHIDESELDINVEELTPEQWLFHFQMLVDVFCEDAKKRVQEWYDRQICLPARDRHFGYETCRSSRLHQIGIWFDEWQGMWDDVKLSKKRTRTTNEKNLIYAIDRMERTADIVRNFYLVSGPPISLLLLRQA